ncbi:MAG: hypothetical protein VX875_07135 [Pseudomonadota bacterium]|jgi:hypothetical protein|nr:hypothetical protein [Pseudomonadota bacterium]
MKQHQSIDAHLATELARHSDEGLILVLHIMHKGMFSHNVSRYSGEFEITSNDILIINSMKKLSDIKKHILSTAKTWSENDIHRFLIDINQQGLNVNKFNFSIVKGNERMKNFFNSNLIVGRYGNNSDGIKSNYAKLVYRILCCNLDFSENDFNHLVQEYSRIHTEFPDHFKNKDREFYIWLKGYLDEKETYDSQHYTPTTADDYKVVINSIFDSLYFKDPDIHYAARKKVMNAWGQKKYRAEGKVKKQRYYALSNKTLELLDDLCISLGKSETDVLTSLINEHYTKQCLDINGNRKFG